MEALVILVAEFLAMAVLAALAAGSTVLVGLVAGLIDIVASAVTRGRGAAPATQGRRKQREKAQRSSRVGAARAAGTETVSLKPPATARRRLRALRIVGLMLVGLGLAVVAGLNAFFFESSVRWALARVETSSGISIAFDSAHGSFYTGLVQLGDVRIQRVENTASEFDLEADEVVVDLNWWGLFGSTTSIDEVRISGLRGTFVRTGVPTKVRVARSFVVSKLIVRDADIEVTDQTRSEEPISFALTIDQLESVPLRSRWAAFDIFFRSNASGTLDGHPFTVESRETDGGRETRWHAESLPVSKVGDYLGGPLAWIDQGRMDIDVTERWQLGREATIDMHYSLLLREVQAGVPSDLSAPAKRVAAPIVAFLNEHGSDLPLSFDLALDRDGFDGSCSMAAAGMWEHVARGLTRELAARAGLDADALERLGRSALDRFKGYLDARSKEAP